MRLNNNSKKTYKKLKKAWEDWAGDGFAARNFPRECPRGILIHILWPLLTRLYICPVDFSVRGHEAWWAACRQNVLQPVGIYWMVILRSERHILTISNLV